MNEQLKFINHHKIHDGILREFVTKKLWSAASQSCDEAISKRVIEINLLQELRNSMDLENIKASEIAQGATNNDRAVRLGTGEGETKGDSRESA